MKHLLALLFLLTAAGQVYGERSEGFKKFQKENQDFDRARKLGFQNWYKRQWKWEIARIRAAKGYKTHKAERDQDVEDDYQKYLERNIRYSEKLEIARQQYLADLNKKKQKETKEELLLTQEDEFGLNTHRPRYKISQRALYGSSPKYKLSIPGSSSNDNYSAPSVYDSPPPSPAPVNNGTDEFSDFNSISPGSSIPYDQQLDSEFPPPYFPEDDIPPPPPIDFDDSF